MNETIKSFEDQLKNIQSMSTTLTLSAFNQLFTDQDTALVSAIKTQGFKQSSETVNKSQDQVYGISDEMMK